VGEKGQIVIHKEAREISNIQPEDTLLLGDETQGIAIFTNEKCMQFADAKMEAKPAEEET